VFIYYYITKFSPTRIYTVYTSKSYLKKSIIANDFIDKWLGIIETIGGAINSIYLSNLEVIVLAVGKLI
jgi:hypothetical protein